MKLIGTSNNSNYCRKFYDDYRIGSSFHFSSKLLPRRLIWKVKVCFYYIYLKSMKKHKEDEESLLGGNSGPPVVILEPKMDNTLTRIFSEGETKIKVNSSAFVTEEEDIFPDDAKQGLCNIRAMLFLVLWYLFSFSTLFLNKYILSYLRGDPTVLGTVQLLMTTTCGLIQMYIPCGLYQVVEREGKPPRFLVNMLIVGSMRFATVILGLLALKFVAVSFTETIKSSAPIFTVVIARLILGEETSCLVNLSLIPVMGGLALCTANEVSFNVQGFLAAMATNIVDCLQNVYSKMLISGEKYRYTPAELQFYTSMAAVVVQIPVSYLLIDIPQVQQTTDRTLFIAFLLNGIFFHFQSITAYALMGYISPVTHSVANTVKRASLIWLSVVMFGNQVSVLSGLGSLVVILGVILYNKAREHSEKTVQNNRKFGFSVPVIITGKR